MARKSIKPRRLISQNENGLGYYGQPLPTGDPKTELINKLGLSGLFKFGNFPTGAASGGTGSKSTGGVDPTNTNQPFNLASGDASYADLLKHFGNGTNSDIIDLMSKLGVNLNEEMFREQDDEWNRTLLGTMLQQLLTENDRSYQKSLLDEQRLYDTPANQLARLMGAGISRDAAIQMLQGSSASAIGTSSAAQVADGSGAVSAAESRYNKVLGAVNTAFSAVSSLSGLVNLGFSIPQALQQTNFARNQNYLTDKQIRAYDAAGQAYAILNNAGSAADAFGSVASVSFELSRLAQSGNTDAQTFIQSGALQAMKENAPFASNVIRDNYMAERGASDHARNYMAAMRKLEAEADLEELRFEDVEAEIALKGAELDKIVADSEYVKRVTQLQDALELESRSKTANLYESTRTLRLGNDLEEGLRSTDYAGKSYQQWFNEKTIMQLCTDARIASKTTSLDYVDAVYKQMFNSAESVAFACALDSLRSQVGSKFFEDYPAEAQLWTGLQKAGCYDYLDAVASGNLTTSTSWGSKFHNESKTTTESKFGDYMQQFKTKKKK